MLLGQVRLDSPLLSPDWHLHAGRTTIASFRRYPSLHLSRGWVGKTPVEMRPQGWGTVVFLEDGREIGRIIRRSWAGRRWELSGDGFGCELVSEPLPRRWTLRVGGQPIAGIAGGLFTYNRVRIQADLSVPVWAVGLVWHVLVRSWEAAAEPRTLRPVTAPR
jgi:hypothetical protein